MLVNDMPNRYQDETLLSDVLRRGDKEKIAVHCDVSPSLISQHCDPDEPKKSWYGCFKRFLWACVQVNPQAADAIFSDLETCYRRWRGLIRTPKQCPARLTGELLRQSADVAEAEIDGKPLEVQLVEAREALCAAQDKVDGLEALIAAERANDLAEIRLGMPKTPVRNFSERKRAV